MALFLNVQKDRGKKQQHSALPPFLISKGNLYLTNKYNFQVPLGIWAVINFHKYYMETLCSIYLIDRHLMSLQHSSLAILNLSNTLIRPCLYRWINTNFIACVSRAFFFFAPHFPINPLKSCVHFCTQCFWPRQMLNVTGCVGSGMVIKLLSTLRALLK